MERLIVTELSKTYQKGNKPALDRFTYTFSDGVYGLLGPNGAGKSTLMNMIVGNLLPTSGEIRYEGKEILSLGKDYRSILGFMPQQQKLYDNFTAQKFLWYFAALKGIPKQQAKEQIAQLLSVVGLSDTGNKPLGSFSGGMKQRVLIAQALLGDPKIVILDEPTAGLDPKERMRLRNFIWSIAQDKTILLATHVISDIEQIARELIFIKEGKQLLSGTPGEVIDRIRDQVWELQIGEAEYESLNAVYPQNRIIGQQNGKLTLKLIAASKPEWDAVPATAVGLEDVYLYLYP